MSRADAAPAIAVTVTACPAAPSVTARSPAMRDSRLAGRNSDITMAKIPRPSDTTPAQALRCCDGVDVSVVLVTFVLLLGNQMPGAGG
jgi:hypothetical protein